jgi:DNA repair protein RAD50
MKIEEKSKQIANVQCDPFFQDFTITEDGYQKFLSDYNNFLKTYSNLNDEERYTNARNNLEKLKFDLRNISEDIFTYDAQIYSKNNIITNFVNNKSEIIYQLNNIENLELKFTNENDYRDILSLLEKKESEVKEKLASVEGKKKGFETKVNEKLNEFEVQKILIKNKRMEIDTLEKKKSELMKLINNSNYNSIKLSEVNTKILKVQDEISKIENLEIKNLNFLINNLEENLKNLNEIVSEYPAGGAYKNSEVSQIYIIKLKESIEKLDRTNLIVKEKISNFNVTFNTNYSTNEEDLTISLQEIINFINRKREDIVEEKQKLREEQCMINTQIDMSEKSLNKMKEEIRNSSRLGETLFNEIKYLFEKLNIPISEEKNLNEDLPKLLIFRSELEAMINNLQNEKTTKSMEIKFLEEYLTSLQEENECVFCNKSASKSEISQIKKNLGNKISELSKLNVSMKSKLEEKTSLMEEINKCDLVIKKLQNLVEENTKNLNRQKELEKDLNSYLYKRKQYENTSKEKTLMIIQLEKFLGINSGADEEIYRLKNDIKQSKNLIEEYCRNLDIQNINSDRNYLINLLDEKTSSFSEFQKLQEEISIVNSQIKEKQTQSGLLHMRLNKLHNDLRLLENEKQTLSKVSDSSDLNAKIFEIESEISSKKLEIETQEVEMNKIMEIQSMLTIKSADFEKICYEKGLKYRTLLEKINYYKIKIGLAMSDIEKVVKNYHQFNQMEVEGESTTNLNAISILNSMIETLKTEKEDKEKSKHFIEKEISRVTDELGLQESEKKKFAMKENLFKNNILIYTLKKELVELNEYLSKNENKILINSKISSAKEKITEKLNLLNSEYNLNLGKRHELNNNLNKLTSDLRNDNYFDIDTRYNKLKVEYILSIETSKQVESYYEALDQSLLKYHAKRMEEINKLINYYWSMTYKGSDIKWIEIRSDVEKTARSRSYNYRIVYGTSE